MRLDWELFTAKSQHGSHPALGVNIFIKCGLSEACVYLLCSNTFGCKCLIGSTSGDVFSTAGLHTTQSAATVAVVVTDRRCQRMMSLLVDTQKRLFCHVKHGLKCS